MSLEQRVDVFEVRRLAAQKRGEARRGDVKKPSPDQQIGSDN
jgi:hypothetical protein